MTILKNTTQRAQGFIQAYLYYRSKNEGRSLYEIYDNYSWNKERALDYCLNLKADKKGFGACFCGHNSMVFSYAFLFVEGGEVYLAYITRDNNYAIALDKETRAKVCGE